MCINSFLPFDHFVQFMNPYQHSRYQCKGSEGFCCPWTILGLEEKLWPFRLLVEGLCGWCQFETVGRLLPMPLRLVRRISLNVKIFYWMKIPQAWLKNIMSYIHHLLTVQFSTTIIFKWLRKSMKCVRLRQSHYSI